MLSLSHACSPIKMSHHDHLPAVDKIKTMGAVNVWQYTMYCSHPDVIDDKLLCGKGLGPPFHSDYLKYKY
jgi:hypothetical protein